MGIWRSKESTADTFEKALSRYDQKIRRIQVKLADVRPRQARALTSSVLYALAMWGVALSVVFQVRLHERTAYDHSGNGDVIWVDGPNKWRTDAMRIGSVLAGPVFVYYVRRLVALYYERHQDHLSSQLETLRTKQRAKIEELKEITAFYRSKELIERYEHLLDGGESNGPLSPSSPFSSNHHQPLIAPPSPAAPNSMQHFPAAPHQPPVTSHPGSPARRGTLAIEDGNPQPSHIVGHQGDFPDPVSAEPSSNNGPGWLDRLVDRLVGGEDPLADPQLREASSKFALICGACYQHNGLAWPPEFPTIKFVCRHCATLNDREALAQGRPHLLQPIRAQVQPQDVPLPPSPYPQPSDDRVSHGFRDLPFIATDAPPVPPIPPHMVLDEVAAAGEAEALTSTRETSRTPRRSGSASVRGRSSSLPRAITVTGTDILRPESLDIVERPRRRSEHSDIVDASSRSSSRTRTPNREPTVGSPDLDRTPRHLNRVHNERRSHEGVGDETYPLNIENRPLAEAHHRVPEEPRGRTGLLDSKHEAVHRTDRHRSDSRREREELNSGGARIELEHVPALLQDSERSGQTETLGTDGQERTESTNRRDFLPDKSDRRLASNESSRSPDGLKMHRADHLEKAETIDKAHKRAELLESLDKASSSVQPAESFSRSGASSRTDSGKQLIDQDQEEPKDFRTFSEPRNAQSEREMNAENSKSEGKKNEEIVERRNSKDVLNEESKVLRSEENASMSSSPNASLGPSVVDSSSDAGRGAVDDESARSVQLKAVEANDDLEAKTVASVMTSVGPAPGQVSANDHARRSLATSNNDDALRSLSDKMHAPTEVQANVD